MLASPLPSGGMKLANSCSSAFLRKNCSSCGLPGPVTDAQRDQIIEKIQRGTAALSAFLLSSPLSGSSPFIGSRTYRLSSEAIRLNCPFTRHVSTVVTVSFRFFRMKNTMPSMPGTTASKISRNLSTCGWNRSGRDCR